MSYFNRVLLMGRLTRDPELRFTPQGTPVLDLGLALNREYTVGTERRKETTFVDVTFWMKQAELIAQYLKKGEPIFVEGRLSLDSWEQDGQKRSKLRVVGENFRFIGSRSGGDSAAEGMGGEEEGGFRGRQGAPSAAPRYNTAPRARGDAQAGYSHVTPRGNEPPPEEALGAEEIPF
jgi:single-strand DNA-binding protein